VIAALVLALLAQATPQRDTRPAPASGTGTISGVVTSADAQPRPLRRVRVQVGASSMTLPRSVITDDDGAFRFDGLPAGDYGVVAVKDGYIATDAGGGHPPRTSRGVTLAEGQVLRVSIALPRGAVMTGTVTDVDGAPAQGVNVTALSRRFMGLQGDYRYVAAGVPAGVTDDRGVYRIYGLPEGEYVVTAQPPFRPGLSGAEVRRLSGNTVDPRPLVMAQVFHPGATTPSAAARIAVRAGEERAADIQLQYVPLATVAGTITLPAGPNTLMLSLVRIEEAAGFDPPRMARPDVEGKFTIPNVLPGQYRILGRSTVSPASVASSGFVDTTLRQFAYADVAVEGEDVTGVALSLQPGLTITGRLVFEGEHPPQALPAELLRTRPFATMTIANSAFTMPPIEVDGMQFKIQGIVPGNYRVAPNVQGLRAPLGNWWLKSIVAGDRDLLDAPLDLRASVADVAVTFTDRASELSGSVIEEQSASPVERWVIAFSANRQGWFPNSRRVAAVRADRTGRYTIRNLPPGDYRVIATRDVEQGEWFDPSVLDRLLPTATPVTIVGVEKLTVDLKLQ
jgi:uncharacterized protein (DUF2141 family)